MEDLFLQAGDSIPEKSIPVYKPYSPTFDCRLCGNNFERTKKNEGDFDICYWCGHEEEG